jgi:hypothetical protein
MLTTAKFRILPSFIGRVAHRINRDARLYANFSREKWRKRFSPGASPTEFPVSSAYAASVIQTDHPRSHYSVAGWLADYGRRQVFGSIGVSGGASGQDEQCAQAGVNALGAQ